VTVDLNGVWAYSEDGLFAVGDQGTILRYDGGAWTEMASGTTENLNDVWGISPADVYATGDNATILHYDGTAWSPRTDIPPFEGDVGRITPGHAATTPPRMNAVITNSSHYSFIRLGARDYWFFSPGAADTPPQINALAVFDDDENTCVAVGNDGGVYYVSDGSEDWHSMDSGIADDLVGIHGRSWTDLIAIGAGGALIRFDGIRWYTVDGTPSGGYSAIAARGYDDLFVFGRLGLVAGYDHCGFSTMNPRTTADLLDGHALAGGSVFACGSGGTVLRYSEPAAGSGCPDNLTVTVTGGPAPKISWTPACNISKIFVEPAEGGPSVWFVSSAGNNIGSGVVYGETPACAEEIRWAAPLDEGQIYSVALVKRYNRGDLVVGRFNYSPSSGVVSQPVLLPAGDGLGWGTYCQTVTKLPYGFYDPTDWTWGRLERIEFDYPWISILPARLLDEWRNPETGLIDLHMYDIEIITTNGVDVLATKISGPQ
jgi:photosystem II stability/assembly factor-like uncharacterized protein